MTDDTRPTPNADVTLPNPASDISPQQRTGDQPNARRRVRTGLMIAIGLAVMLVIGGAVAGVTMSRTATTSADHTTAAAPTSVRAAPPGFQTVQVPSDGIAYDVPTNWTVKPTGDPVAFLGMVGAGEALEGAQYCAGFIFRSMAFVATDTRYPAAAAEDIAKQNAGDSYNDAAASVTPAVARSTTGGINGQLSQVSGRYSQPGCGTSGYSIWTFAFDAPEDPNRTLALTIMADRGITGELEDTDATTIIDSVRRYTPPSNSSGPTGPGAARTFADAGSGITFPVPATWTVTNHRGGVDIPGGTLSGHVVAQDNTFFCRGYIYKSSLDVTTTTMTDLSSVVVGAAHAQATAAFSDRTGGQVGTPAQLTSVGGIRGLMVESDGSQTPSPEGCSATGYSVYAFAFPVDGATMVLILAADRGVPGELTPDQAQAIFTGVQHNW
jgi:hypothetical protein